MIFGTARDAAVYFNNADFEVGVFDYPLPAPDDPGFADVEKKPLAEASVPSIHFCLSRMSQYPETALDFMMFCTSQARNESFNKDVGWYPAIRGAEPRPELAAFEPRAQGASGRVPPLTVGPDVQLWFDQQFVRYLEGDLPLDEMLEGLEEEWLTKGVNDYVRRDRLFQRVLIQLERNVANAKSKILFEEAGELKAGEIMGERTIYQLSLEIVALLEHGVSARAYMWHHLQEGDWEFP